MAVAAFGQDPGNIDSLAFGNTDGSPMNIFIDSQVQIPVWLKCDENVSFAHLCLATENLYVTSRLYFIPAGPFLDWDLQGTFPVDGWPQDGYTSQSVMGIADFSLPQPNYVNTDGEWVLLGYFLIGTTDDVNAIGQTTPLVAGEHPVQGVTVMFDETWTPIVPAMTFSSLVFLDAVPPVITSPENGATISANSPYPFGFTVTATDADDEVITLTLNMPFTGYTFNAVTDTTGYAEYQFSWAPPPLPDTVFHGQIIAEDPNGLQDIVDFDLHIEPVEVFVTSDSTLPGYATSIDIYLNQSGDNSHVGGFNLVLQWDSAVLTFQQAVFANDLANWGYTHVEINPLGPGSIRLTGIANAEPGDDNSFLQGEHHVGTVYFLADDDPGLQGFTLPINMPITNMTLNVLSDSTGYMVYHPAITPGHIDFMDTGNILIGDVNLNGYAYETGDVVVYVAHLVDPVANPFNPTQRFASDCNQDGITESIADLVLMINIINGGGDGLSRELSGNADLQISSSGQAMTVTATADFPAGGVVLTIDHKGSAITNVAVPDGYRFEYADKDGQLTAVIYTANPNRPLAERLLEFEIASGNPRNIKIDSFEISDIHGNLLKK